uniref:Uncharacterized protein n=1 Tax=Arundo donax TaxID=35708 RepID=A0A0A8ZPX0_ARUDO
MQIRKDKGKPVRPSIINDMGVTINKTEIGE